MTPEEFRTAAHQVIDWMVEYRSGLEALPVLSPVEPGWVRSQLPNHPPAAVEPFDAVMDDVRAIITPGITHWAHPSFFAYFPSNSSWESTLGEMIGLGFGINAMSWTTSPAATELETTVMDWMLELLDLPEAFRGNGVIQDTASSSTLVSVLAARDRARQSGASIDQLVGYATAQAHSSIEKDLRVAGIPAARFHVVPHDDSFAMRPDALASMVAADRAAGLVPFWVCAARGSTSSMAMDPVPGIADVCERERLWLHVDAAMAGVAGVCPEFRWVNEGLDRADSYTTNGHKWMGVNFECSFFWVRDRAPMLEALSILPEYLRSAAAESGSVIDYRDWQIPLGKRFRAVKVWTVLRCLGVEAIRSMMRDHVAWTDHIAALLAADHRFVLAAPVNLNLVCFRLTAGDDATLELVEQVNRSGLAELTKTVLDGRPAIRISIGNASTEKRHIDALWSLLDRLA